MEIAEFYKILTFRDSMKSLISHFLRKVTSGCLINDKDYVQGVHKKVNSNTFEPTKRAHFCRLGRPGRAGSAWPRHPKIPRTFRIFGTYLTETYLTETYRTYHGFRKHSARLHSTFLSEVRGPRSEVGRSEVRGR